MARRWLVLGGTGMLGQDLDALLRSRGESVVSLGSAGCDVTELETVQRVIGDHAPDVVVNCAAYTAVDAAESDEAAAFALNGTGAFNVARTARAADAQLVHVSTDYVFDGRAEEPYDVEHPQALERQGRSRCSISSRRVPARLLTQRRFRRNRLAEYVEGVLAECRCRAAWRRADR